MKKIALLFMVVMLVMFGVLAKVQAKENVLEVNLYEYEKISDIEEDDVVSNLISKMIDSNTIIPNCESVGSNGEETCSLSYNGKIFNISTIKYDPLTNNTTYLSDELSFENFTRDDTFEYIFSDQEKAYFIENPDDPFAGYDKIIVNFSNRPGSVMIKNIELIEKTGMAVINSPATIDGLNINVDVKFKDVNDRVVYKALVKNNSDKDYYLTKGNISNTDEYIKYEFDYDEGNDIIKSGETRYVTITMSYDKEVPAAMLATGKYQSAQKLGLVLTTEKEEIVAEANPKTVDGVMKAVLVLAISIVLLVIMVKVRALRKAMMVVLALVMIMPAVAKAIEKLDITINTKAEVTKNPSFGYYKVDASEPIYYEYEEGMTWEDWYNSEYFDDNVYIFLSGEEDYFKCEAGLIDGDCFQFEHTIKDSNNEQIRPFIEVYYGPSTK